MATIFELLHSPNTDTTRLEKVNATLDMCEYFINTLDESVVEFVTKVSREAPAGPGSMGLMNHTIGFLLCSVFSNPEEVINIICEDEKWQKWEGLEDFHKASDDGNNLPPVTYLYKSIYNTNTPITNVKGEEFELPRTKLPIDFAFDSSASSHSQYGDFCGFLDDSRRFDDLSQWQKNNCYVGVFSSSRGSSDFGPTYKQPLANFNLLKRACQLKDIEDGKYSVRMSRDSEIGVWVPIKKIDMEWSSSNADADTIIDRRCIDMYNLPVEE